MTTPSRQWLALWLCLIGVWWGASLAVRGFVRPWVSIRLKSEAVGEAVGRVSQDAQMRALAEKLAKHVGRISIQVRQGDRMVGGDLPDITTLPRQMSGYDIPRLLHRSDMQGLVSLAELLLKQHDIALKSYAVYLVPGLALLFAVLLTVASQSRGLCLGLALASAAIVATLWWRLSTLRAETPLLRLVIEGGLWQSVVAYGGVGLSAW